MKLAYYLSSMNKKLHAVLVSVTTVITFIFTLHPAIQPYLFRFFELYVICSLFAFAYYYWARKKKITTKITPISVYLVSVTILFVVGLTDWFYSPFIYLLYLLAILYSFVFSPVVTLFFCLTLIGLFLPYTQSVPLWYSGIMFSSLLGIIPLTNYLQRQHLLVKQAEKKVLILEDGKRQFKDTADEYLHNKVSRVATQIREQADDIRQLANYSANLKKKYKSAAILDEIIELSNGLLRTINEFEEKTTGRKRVAK